MSAHLKDSAPFPGGLFADRPPTIRATEPAQCPECKAVRGFVSIIHQITCSRIAMTKADVERVLGGAG